MIPAIAVADPARLVLALPRVTSAEGRRFADIYNRVVDRLVEQSPIDRMPLIHMTAQMEDPDLSPFLQSPVPPDGAVTGHESNHRRRIG
jgi:hypothetical protein